MNWITMMIRTSAIGVILFYLLTVVSWLLMVSMAGGTPPPYSYPNAPGYEMAIMWFEMVRSVEELFSVLGPYATQKGKHLRAVLDLTNEYDYIFMIFYSLFHIAFFLWLIGFARQLFQFRGLQKPLLRYVAYTLAVLLPLLIWLADLRENHYLLLLTRFELSQPGLDNYVAKLHFWAYMKWALLFVASFAFAGGIGFIFCRFWYRVLALLCLVTGVLGFFSLYVPGFGSWIEIASGLLFLSWTGAFLLVVLFFFSLPAQTQSPFPGE